MQPINWTKWSAIAEVLGSIAIVVTLIYLTVQTQQNAAAIQANSRHAMINTDVQILLSRVADPIPWVMSKEDPTPEELERLELWLIALVRTREHQWFQLQDGLLDRRTFDAYLSGLSVNLSYPRSRRWWDYVKYRYFDDEFAEFVSEYLSQEPLIQDGGPTIGITDELEN